ncbi:hypothetical protein [Pedobacter flavus]|uniref:Uncharacterized protein n=1 Tax=Pedobacter flavus TaxID=3113906 RepID=A0ABU7GY45_9SPHI|nr:hypothetical protein [Pedobacter sp. VNH31]MEE1883939.1 hypothetical protein [Pedobacter sp. VNH31]
MEAKNYEYLLNSVFTNVQTSNGVDAEMYLVMIEEHNNILLKNFYDSHQERVLEFKKAFSIVREQVLFALVEGGKKIIMNASEDEMNQLQTMINVLNPSFYDIAELNNIINTSIRIFARYGICNQIQRTSMFKTNNSFQKRAFRD